MVLLPPNPTNTCFGCGGANERGMKLTFEQDDDAKRIRGRFALGAEYEGGKGYIHGGMIAVVLDEVMGKVCRFRGVRAVTAELNLEYLRPVKVDAMLRGLRSGDERAELVHPRRDLGRSGRVAGAREGAVRDPPRYRCAEPGIPSRTGIRREKFLARDLASTFGKEKRYGIDERKQRQQQRQ